MMFALGAWSFFWFGALAGMWYGYRVGYNTGYGEAHANLFEVESMGTDCPPPCQIIPFPKSGRQGLRLVQTAPEMPPAS